MKILKLRTLIHPWHTVISTRYSKVFKHHSIPVYIILTTYSGASKPRYGVIWVSEIKMIMKMFT